MDTKIAVITGGSRGLGQNAAIHLAKRGVHSVITAQDLGANATAQMIDVAKVQGQVHAQSVHRVGELAERNPNETASIVRQWLTEPAA